MPLQDSFTFVTKDPDWVKKIFIGAIVTAIPFFGAAASNGYQFEVIKNLIKRAPIPLPDWEDMGKMFANGFKLQIAIYSLYIPGIILFIFGWFLGLRHIIELVMILCDVGHENAAKVNIGFFLGEKIVRFLLGVVLSLILPISFLFVPAMVRRCAKYNSFASAFNFCAHLKFILRHLGDYVLAFIAVFIVLFFFYSVSSVVGGVTLFIGGIGALLAWFGIALGRFWSRMMWAYNLAEMELKTY